MRREEQWLVHGVKCQALSYSETSFIARGCCLGEIGVRSLLRRRQQHQSDCIYIRSLTGLGWQCAAQWKETER